MTWHPTGARHTRGRPEVDQLVPNEHAVWRILDAKTRQQAMKRLVERHPEEFDRIHRDLLLLNLTHTDREATT